MSKEDNREWKKEKVAVKAEDVTLEDQEVLEDEIDMACSPEFREGCKDIQGEFGNKKE